MKRYNKSMVRRISVTTLTKGCPLYIKLTEMYPLEGSSIEASFGSWIHQAIAIAINELSQGNIPTPENLLFSAASRENSPLIKTMLTDDALYSEAVRMLKNALNYIETNIPIGKKLLIEKKLELFIKEPPTTIVGILDLGYENTIIDWKTGTYTAEEHFLQLRIYAYMVYKLEIMSPPITIKDVYLGGDTMSEVKAVFSLDEIRRTENFITNLLMQSLNSPQPRPSDSCSLCEYKFRCPLYFRLSKERDIMQKIDKINKKIDHASQYRKLGMQLKNLATKLNTIAEGFINTHANIMNDINQTPPNAITETKIWASSIIPLLSELSQEEKEQLLIALLREYPTIPTKHIPETINEKLKPFTKVDVNKVRKLV